ncbi:MAG: ABC transporter permease subunit [Deltaproteobacteria bacterium]|nr:ABC transporter permease subunit [Deltaproteobacteria bacterium]
MVRVWVLAAILVGCAGCARDDAGGTLAAIKARGTITYGADLAGGEPYIFEDPQNPKQVIGFEVDLMQAVARRLGVKAEMKQYAWSNLVPSLERGDFDIVMNGLEATAERQSRIRLSEAYFIYAETLAVRHGSPYKNLADLKGKRVGTLNQTVAHDLLRAEPLEVVIYEGNEEPYIDLEQGRIDAVLLDNIIADRYGCIAARPSIVCVPDEIARGTYVIGARKADADLVKAIDSALAAMRADGELERILRKVKLWDVRQTQPAPAIAADSGVRSRAFDGTQVTRFLEGALVTLQLSVLAFLIAVPIGLLLAVARVFGSLPARVFARIYIEVFRGTPVLLQLFLLYYGLAPYYSMGPITAAVLGLGLNYAAYEAEVYRGALLAIPRGQSEAARALGLSPWQSLRHVLVPQALRLALPPMTNDFVSLLKDSSLVSVITVIELTKRMQIAAVDMRGWLLPGLACAALYLAMSVPLSELARRLERRLARDQRPQAL